MKTTLELPDALVRELKLRALNEGRKLKDMVAELLRRGLDAAPSTPTASEATAYDDRSGFPVIACKHAARRGHALSPDRVAEILLGQDVEWQSDAGR